MGKGIGMPAAQQTATGRTVRAAQVNNSAAPFACVGCGVSVDHVNGYWTNKQDPELAREVQAFFRLRRGANHQHAATCPYTPVKQVQALVAEAEAVEDSINPFERRRPSGPVVFRLNIPDEEVRREGRVEVSSQVTSYKTRVERVWSGRRLEAYCRSAVGLAKLWQALEGPDAVAELRKYVRIEQSGRPVPWEDFFFPLSRIRHFADRFESDSHQLPVALLLHVQSLKRSKEGRLSIRFTPIADPDASPDARIAIEAYGEDQVLHLCEPGHHYVVFGSFWHRGSGPWTSSDKSKTITYRNFAIKLYRSSQIAKVDVVDPRGGDDPDR